MDYTYNRDLFREYLSYPDKEDLKNYHDIKRLEKLELLIMDWIQNKPQLIKKEFTIITKNFWTGAIQQAMKNMRRMSRNYQEYKYLVGI